MQFLKIIPANESIRIFVAGELLSRRLVPPAQPHQAFPLVELQPVKDGSAISVSKSDRFYISHSLSLTHTHSLSLSLSIYLSIYIFLSLAAISIYLFTYLSISIYRICMSVYQSTHLSNLSIKNYTIKRSS